MKYEDLRKRLIKESAIIAGAIAVLGGGVYYFDLMVEEAQQQNSSLQGQVASIRSETIQLQNDYAKVQKNSVLYQEAMAKNADHHLTISRQAARDHFDKLRNLFYLNNMHLTMSPITPLTDSKYKRKTSGMESSDVSLTFEAISDEYVYDMLQAMQQELPGSSKIVDLTLRRVQPLSVAALQSIGQTGSFALVTGSMKFTWFGIIPKDADNADVPPKK